MLRLPATCLAAEKGRTLLELLLAKLGIPLEEAQRSFAGEGCEPLMPPPTSASAKQRSVAAAQLCVAFLWSHVSLVPTHLWAALVVSAVTDVVPPLAPSGLAPTWQRRRHGTTVPP